MSWCGEDAQKSNRPWLFPVHQSPMSTQHGEHWPTLAPPKFKQTLRLDPSRPTPDIVIHMRRLRHELVARHLEVLDLLREPRLRLRDIDHLGSAQAVGIVEVASERRLLRLELGGHGREPLSEQFGTVERPLESSVVSRSGS